MAMLTERKADHWLVTGSEGVRVAVYPGAEGLYNVFDPDHPLGLALIASDLTLAAALALAEESVQ